MASHRDRAADDGGMGFILFMGTVMALSLAVIWQEERLSGLLLDAARALLRPLAACSRTHRDALAALSGLDWGAISLGEAWEVLERVARWYAWPVGIPLMAALAAWNWRLSVADRCRRRLGMRDLLEEDLAVSPCVAPALNWPGGILAEPLDEGPWRAGRQPLQLVAERGLLLDMAGGREPVPAGELLGPDNLANPRSPWLDPSATLILDRKGAEAMFREQMGPRWEGFEALPPHLKKLTCAWVFFACGEKDRAQELLDAMSLSFRAPRAARPAAWKASFPLYERALPAQPYRMDTRLAASDEAACRGLLKEDVRLVEALRPHGVWRDLALLALYEAARTRGVLPCAEFLWLRPVDRPLWYLCNTMGRRTAWPEIAGPWAHYRAECRMGTMDPLFTGEPEPQVTAAVDALEVAMWEEGWIRAANLSDGVRARRAKFGVE